MIFFLTLILCTALHAAESAETLINRVRKEHVNFVQFNFSDPIYNRVKTITRPITYAESDIKNGLKIDGSSVPGCRRITESDMLAVPDLNTASKKLPWTNEHTSAISVMCDIYEEAGQPFVAHPREILKRELNRAHELGFEFLVGPELEFYLFDKELKMIDDNGYLDYATDWKLSNNISEMLAVLNYLDMHIEKIHHEVGPGQYEMSIECDNALKIADAITMTKHTLQSMAHNLGINVSFMPKPVQGKAGSGMHINFSLSDKETGANLFYDDEDKYNLSPLAKSFIAGIIKYVKECSLLFNSTVNSFKRLIPGFEAPIFICCGQKNRSALIRLPYSTNPQGVRGELRSPDALCNPYLAFAALLKAGLAGVDQNLRLESIISENLYDVDAQTIQQLEIDVLPNSFREAIALFESSSFVRELLGKHLFNQLIKAKKKELMAFEQAITDWEIERYLY